MNDKKVFEKILAKADILVENKPGTLEKWGFGWNEVSYPKLIYAFRFWS